MKAATQSNRQHTPFYWHLMDYEGVKISDVVVYGYLLGWQKSAKDPNSKVKRVFPSLDRIGSDLRISSKSVGRSVALLEKLGFLIKERPNRRMSYLYTVVELDDLPSVAPAAEPQEFNQPTEQGPADEHANDSPVQNVGHQDQTTGGCHVVGSPVGTAFTSVFAVVPVIEDAFAFPEVKPATSETWLDAPFTPRGELIPEAVQHCIEQGVTDPEERKHFVRKLVDPDYVREKPISNPTPAAAPEWEDQPF
ncbi:hypothetical protein [Serratia quinivorans]|uniref:hypothetical protein n=1 Tax=Serratia quinivorans TaxID=137545 RepID=UPI0021797F2A|nr:hypothetical protein [Serratia quinivorans]CAI1715697.1 Uncharacterised protein [Serratia quinivorans]CAI1799372.1 Uncharacterised protein [Serratia quinivorans]